VIIEKEWGFASKNNIFFNLLKIKKLCGYFTKTD